MAKTLCRMTKILSDDFEAYAELVKGAKFVCGKCGRAAAKKKSMCKPRKA